MAEAAKKTEWDEFINPDTANAQALAPDSTSPAAPKKTEWDEYIAADDTQAMIDKNTGVMGALRDFFKYSGHLATRDFANTLGMPVDVVNSVGSFLADNPGLNPMGLGPLAGLGDAAKALHGARGGKPIYAGSGESFRDAAKGIGLPISTPKEDNVHSSAAELGAVFGEFGLGSLPFVAALPAKVGAKTVTNLQRILRSDRPATELLKELGMSTLGPTAGAEVGMAVAGEKHEELGKAAGGFAGGLRLGAVEYAAKKSKNVGSWLRDFFGAGQVGAEKKVGEALAETASDLPGALKNIKDVTGGKDLVPGAKGQLPTDIAAGDMGLIGLRISNLRNNAEMIGDYKAKERAVAAAIEDYTQLSKVRETDPLTWFSTRQTMLQNNAEASLANAVRQAEQDTEYALRGATTNERESTLVKAAYAANLRTQIVGARDDFDMVVQQFWKDVDKTVPVDMEGVYDTVNMLRAEHKGRPAQDAARFPKEVFDRFFKPSEFDPDVMVPKFGPGTRLQEVIDLDSAVQQTIRELTAEGAGDATKISYLDRLSKSLYKAKESLSDASTNMELKAALNATKTYHDTFTRGPVGNLLGHDTAGAPSVVPGNTIRHFLTQGPGSVDNFDKMMKAFEKRTGAVQPLPAPDQIKPMLKEYLRQDFYDHAMPNGEFNEARARKWMSSRAGAITHFDDLRQDFEAAIKSQGEAVATAKTTKQTLEEVRSNAAALFLEGNPGPLFNGALKGPDQYGATKKLLEMTKEDTSGKATEGLVQMAFDHMLSSSKVVDKTVLAKDLAGKFVMERLSGEKLLDWIKDHKGAIRALDEALPKATTSKLSSAQTRARPAALKEPGVKRPTDVASRFEQVAETARYLEMFRHDPKIPAKQVKPITPLMEIMARWMGADIGAKLASGGTGHSFQMANLGSSVFKQIFEKLTPEKAGDILRRAMNDPVFFEKLTASSASLNTPQAFSALRPYFVSMGIPIIQPFVTPGGGGAGPLSITVRPGDKEGGGADVPSGYGTGFGGGARDPHDGNWFGSESFNEQEDRAFGQRKIKGQSSEQRNTKSIQQGQESLDIADAVRGREYDKADEDMYQMSPRQLREQGIRGSGEGGGSGGGGGGGDPNQDTLLQPPHNPSSPFDLGRAAAAGARTLAPNISSLVAGDEPPPLQTMSDRPGKTSTTDDPRIAGAVGEVGQGAGLAASLAGPAGVGGLAARGVESVATKATASLGNRVVENVITKASGGAGVHPATMVGGATAAAGDSSSAQALTQEQKDKIAVRRENARIDSEKSANAAKLAKEAADETAARNKKAAEEATDRKKQELAAETEAARQKAEDAARVATEQKENEARLEKEHQQRQADRSFREKFPELSSAFSNSGILLAGMLPVAGRLKSTGPMRRFQSAWEDAAEKANEALKKKDMFQAKVYIDQLAAFKKQSGAMEKAAAGADRSSLGLNVAAGTLPAELGSIPEAADMMVGTPKAKEKAKETLLDPMRIPPAIATGAVMTGLGSKVTLPGKKFDVERLRATSEGNIKSLKDLKAAETKAAKKAPKKPPKDDE